MARIDDGTGQGFAAQVTSTNRLAVSAESIPSIAIASAQRQDAFVICTAFASASGLVPDGGTLAIGVESAVLWFQNLSPFPLALGGFSAATSQAGVFKIYRQPGTAGTIVSGGTAVSPTQLNFASSKGFTGLARATNASGQTLGGGTVVALGLANVGFTELALQGALILGQNDTCGLTFTPSTVAAQVSANAIVAYLS